MNETRKDPYKIVINWDEGAMYNFLPVQAASERDDVDAAAIKAMLEEAVDEHAKAGVDVLVHGVFSGFMCMMPYPRLRDPAGGGVHVPATAVEHQRWCKELGTPVSRGSWSSMCDCSEQWSRWASLRSEQRGSR